MITRHSVVLIALVSLGCTSFRTTIMQRAPDHRFYPNQPCAKTKGIPVKLKVPSHVEARIVEHYFITSKPIPKTAPASQNKAGYKEVSVKDGDKELRTLQVETKLIYTEKIFTVDFRRPAGGLLNLTNVNFDSNQYFLAIQAEYEEQTLSQINSALGTLKPSLTAKSKSATSTAAPVTPITIPEGNDVISDTRIVAFSRFDISEPDWEAQLHDFVGQHVTCCHNDCHYRD